MEPSLGLGTAALCGGLIRPQVWQDHEQVVCTSENWKAAMIDKGWRIADSETNSDEEDERDAAEQPAEETLPLDDAPVPPLTEPDDTEGG